MAPHSVPPEEPISVEEIDVGDLDKLDVRETSKELTDKTRAHIAKTLTYATIGLALILGLVLAACIARLAWMGVVTEGDVQRLTPLITLVVSQTLVPLTTIAITWYFASRSFEEREKGEPKDRR